MLMGLNLLSQPAQAISWNFSYSAFDNTSFTGTLISDGNSSAINTVYNLTGISGTVTRNGTPASVSISSYGGFADNTFVWNGTTGIALNAKGIGFTDSNNVSSILFSPAGGSNTSLGSYTTNSVSGVNFLFGVATSGILTSSSLTPATAVPWETDALPVIGSTVLFGFGLWAKQKFGKPLQK